MSRRYVIEVEADAHSAAFLLGFLQAALWPWSRKVTVCKVEPGTIQGICDEAHAIRDAIEAAS